MSRFFKRAERVTMHMRDTLSIRGVLVKRRDGDGNYVLIDAHVEVVSETGDRQWVAHAGELRVPRCDMRVYQVHSS